MDRRIKNLLLAALCLTILLAPISFMGNPVEANDHDNIDLKKFNIEQVSFTKGEMKTREASVKVYNEAGGHGSGAYFLYKGHHVIFTAAHVFPDPI